MHRAVFIVILLVGLGSFGALAEQTVRVTKESPIEAKFAVLELGNPGRDQVVPAALVSEFDKVFKKLEGTCKHNRQELGDMGVVAVRGLRKSGRAMGYLEFLRGVDSLLGASKELVSKAPTDCQVVFVSAWMALEK